MKKIILIMSIVAAIGFFCPFLCTNGMANQIYQWIDKDGVKHFTNYPPDTEQEVSATREIPSTYVALPVKNKNIGNELKTDVVEKKTYKKKASGNNKVELFSTSWCKYCVQAREFLTANNIPFTEYDIERDKSAAKRKMKLSGRNGVPFALINGNKIFGFSKGTYAKALGLQ